MTTPEIDSVLRNLEQHQRDLHLLFTNDVSSMDLTLYNAVTLALITAESDIRKALEEHDKKMKQYYKHQEKIRGE